MKKKEELGWVRREEDINSIIKLLIFKKSFFLSFFC